MNVIVSNKQKEILDNANIDAIKDLNGLFNVEDLINNFKNYFFTKMILDATSVVEFANPDVLRKLAKGIGAEKLVILLPESPDPPKKFLEMLIELGIYNFSTKIDDVVNFLQNPNTYDDVKFHFGGNDGNVSQMQNNVNNMVDSNVNMNNSVNENNNINVNRDNNYQANNNGMFNNIDLINTNDVNSNINGFENNYSASNENINVSQNINNVQPIGNGNMQTEFPRSSEEHQFNYGNTLSQFNNDNYDNIQNNASNIYNFNDMNNVVSTNNISNMNTNVTYDNLNNKYILGVKNVTSSAGSTSLIYMLKQTLEYKFRKKVLAIELNSNDFPYFRDNNMISIPVNKLDETINNSNYDVILLDLNNTNYESLCTEVIYLVEPSILKLNKLMSENKKAFELLNGKRVVLNKCILSNTDIDVFSREAGFSFFFVLPPLNDRVGNSILETFINKLNINNGGEKRGFLGLFNKNS